MTEKQWQAIVEKLLRTFGFRVYHTWSSLHSTRGFPDIVAVRPPRLIFAELKSETGRVSIDQEDWLLELGGCGVEAYVWRPNQIDEIAEILQHKRKMA